MVCLSEALKDGSLGCFGRRRSLQCLRFVEELRRFIAQSACGSDSSERDEARRSIEI